MIVVDSSALMAIVLDEPSASTCMSALADQNRILISAATLTEALIVAGRRGRGPEMRRLVDGLGLEVVGLTREEALRAASAYERFGRSVHPAALNYGDCFAYELAKHSECPLLFVGDDFSRTDVSPLSDAHARAAAKVRFRPQSASSSPRVTHATSPRPPSVRYMRFSPPAP